MTTTHSESPASHQFQSIQALRGIAALMVVCYHMVQAEIAHGAGGNLLDRSFASFGYAGVDLFFVISGFVMTTIASGSYQSPRNALDFLTRRAARVLPLYYLFTLLIVALLVLRPSMILEHYESSEIVASFLLLPQHQHPLLQVGWTLTYEALFYLLMAVAIATVKEMRMPYFLGTWALIIFCGQFYGSSNPWVVVATSPMGWEFIAGASIGLLRRELKIGTAWACFTMGAIIFALSAELLLRLGIFGENALLRVAAFGAPASLVVLGAVRLDRAGLLQPPALLQRIGDASYSLYLSHLFVLSLIARLWDWSHLNQPLWTHVAFFFISGSACVVVSEIVYVYVERPLLAFSKIALKKSSKSRRTDEPHHLPQGKKDV